MLDSIYIHIPFCNKKCSYCDFYILTNMKNAYEKYTEYIIKEIKYYDYIYYDSIYFGGGTPSVLEVSQLKSILKSLKYDASTEITLELNPTNMTKEKLRELRLLGVNRLSIGMQSFDDKILELMNREHRLVDNIKTYKDARLAGFDNISFDLIFAIPSQTMKQLKKDIDYIEKLNPDHISIYSLIWEDGSKFSKLLKEQKIQKIDEDLEVRMFKYIIRRLKKLGYEHYEVSSFCKNKKYGRHNMKYWENKEFIGVGISASSYYKGKRYEKVRKLLKYYEFIDKGLEPIDEASIEYVDEKELKNLDYILGLRKLNTGIKYYEEDKEVINKYIKKGLLKKRNNRVLLTKKGLFLADSIVLDFIT